MVIFRQKQQVLNLAAINITQLKSDGICGIILDLDNTLISEDDNYISPDGEEWIKQAESEGIKFFILSNGKRRYRVDYWSSRLGIPAISPAYKPLPFSFRKAQAAMGLKSKEIVAIGDSFHTDILGSWLVGFSSIQVTSLPHPPRWWERIMGRWVQIPYLSEEEERLVQFDISQYQNNAKFI
ncbi:YqeG family HAD IIIA-type phosphatase [Limnofasciculus baicalensis]|uniref:YqeG family HAD IIIA-type phosphatase n=1 Tax=Limnofasciculus baicalensis BBK-W-15 TaxID=2699891 RepID=A0AAE3GM52_9CYAN|nr:YqeG family HAD IIIA-type phosphatase [Limnofasciculus baicalensis]MCP2726904.1 YqeG family HAD IIIA-type phosphatase [Limnofasciculus baicalensis BBK-W-15]